MTCCVVKINYETGQASEINLNFKKDPLTPLLGYSKTFLGQIEEDRATSVVFIAGLEKTPRKVGLPPPFQAEMAQSDVYCVRMRQREDQSETDPVDFALCEFFRLYSK